MFISGTSWFSTLVVSEKIGPSHCPPVMASVIRKMRMKDKISNFIISVNFLLKSMPLALRFIAALCLAALCLAGTILPIMKFHIGGKELTYRQFWASGAGIETFTLGISLFITGIGICLKKKWSKNLLVLIFIFYSVIIPALHKNMQISIVEIVALLILLAPLIWYLYFKKSVQDYFGV